MDGSSADRRMMATPVLVITPFALHYHGVSDPGRANDLLVGIVVVVLAMLGTINCSFAWQPPRRPHRI